MGKPSKSLIFVAGLGNPGAKYYNTPHSLGFLVADEFARRHAFPDFEMKIGGLLISEKEINGTAIILAKPQTFMNNSGREIVKLLKQKKALGGKNYPHLWVINDDLDLPFGKIRLAKNRGGAGHKGVQSIIGYLKTKKFIRFRVGIKKPGVEDKKITPEIFVLKAFKKTDESAVAALVKKTADALDAALCSGLDKAMTEFNR